MKSMLYKILSLCMAVVVVLSTLSFGVDMHFCGDSMVDFSLLGKAEVCGMEKEKTMDSHSDCSKIEKQDCCTNKVVFVQGQETMETPISFEPLVNQQLLVAVLAHIYSNLFLNQEQEKPNYQEYPPPLLTWDIHKLNEVYII
ncbi:MAG: HYC_CC_PP family protein [Bacteroidales bacterium]